VALVIADENLSWSDWGRAGSWRPSIQVYESPLEWRQRCFSQDELNDPLISGDEADPDGDGVCNRQEYLAGTNPREAESRLRLSVAVGPDGARARFEAAPGRSYGLQSASSLDDGVWQFLMSVPAQDSAQVVELPLPAPAPSQAKFFRVVMPAGP
jgi:hypothetical protein